jgi:hypothetical protein
MAQHPRTSLFQRGFASQCLISRRYGPEGEKCCRDWMWFIRGSDCSHYSTLYVPCSEILIMVGLILQRCQVSSHFHQVAYLDHSRLCTKQSWAWGCEFLLYVALQLYVDPESTTNEVPDSESQKTDFRTDPRSSLQYRKDIENELNSRFRFVRQSHPGLNISRLLTSS